MQTARQWIQTLRKKTWSNTVIEGHAVDCQAVHLDQEFIPAEESALWISRHVQQWSNALMMNAVNRLKQSGCQCLCQAGLCHFLLCTTTE